MRYDAVVIRFGEIWLKGRNRADFINRLFANIKASINGLDYKELADERDRFMVYADKQAGIPKILERLSSIPGISSVSPVVITKPRISGIIKVAKEINKNQKRPVRIEVNRSYKLHEFDSNELVGEFLKLNRNKKLGFPIDSKAGDKLYINLLKNSALIYKQKVKGVGGLPVGSSGKTIVLLSGGIDSPVAAFYAMKRGLEPIYVHFHTFASNSAVQTSKMPKMLRSLARYSGPTKVYYAPSHLFQAATMKAPPKYELVLFKMFMYRFAERVAEKEDANSITTGESLGQVASQTAENMAASQTGLATLLLRPLTGMDKSEIIDKAKEIGTYGLSVERYRDVCSIKIKNPATKALPRKVTGLYAKLSLGEVLSETYGAASSEESG